MATGRISRTGLLPKIVEHCRSKITDTIMQSRGRESLHQWAKWNPETQQIELESETPEPVLKDIRRFERVCRSVDPEASISEVCKILIAAGILTSPIMAPVLDVSLLPELAKLYLSKIARYLSAANNIVACLVYLRTRRRQGVTKSFVVEPVGSSTVMTSASQDGEPPDLDTYLSENFDLSSKSLLPSKAGGAKDSWALAREKPTLFFHAELKMAIFYALNPDLFPVGGYIAVSKKCCKLCDFVLKSVGPPMNLCEN